ncbi:MAG: NADH-quinone oxidoreductase subunit L [Planctomycetota bacterium]
MSFPPAPSAAPLSGDPADLLLLATPITLAIAAAVGALPRTAVATTWQLARAAAAFAVVLALGAAGVGLALPASAATPRGATVAQLLLAPLIAAIGLVIVRFSSRYVAGEVGERRFARWLLLTLAGATFVVATDHLLLLTLGWLVTSLSLQRLLTFYPTRPMARIAALEKFLVSRAADACMLTATALLASHAGTLHIGELLATTATAPLQGEARVATLLIAVAALLKCAQLPFHGWLLRVMEAPTPVSALLHAGVVNLGGFVLIRMWPLVEASSEARWLLVLVGGITAALAALAATTQPAVKLALAWSTCAQMGFMLLQCGLGLPEMALLHLIAHSAYKAHAFLTASSSVRESATDALAPDPVRGGLWPRAVAALVGVAMVATIGGATGALDPARPELLAAGAILSFALVPLLLAGRRGGARPAALGLLTAAAVTFAWFTLHQLLHGAVSTRTPHPTSPTLAAAALLTLLPLLAVRMRLAWRPGGELGVRLHRLCQRGLFLDAWFTRLVTRLGRTQPPTASPRSIALLPSRNLHRGEL